ncbi:MAG: hypothetical protein M5R36_00220 [Deltaproteobacteria bacterium]|nr:hypothetical protein [Deltaproteobacteria bacterium]
MPKPAWWSEGFNAHLLKAVQNAWPEIDARDDVDLAQTVRGLIAEHFSAAVFRAGGEAGDAYLHANCYALEGLLGLEAAQGGFPMEDAAARLAEIQQGDGGLPRRFPANAEVAAADATAQAARIWQIVDAQKFTPSIDAALAFFAQARGAGWRRSVRPRNAAPQLVDHDLFIQALVWRHAIADAAWIV